MVIDLKLPREGGGADKSEIWESFGAVVEKEDLAVRVSAKRESKALDLGKGACW
jgi:hypothetical protein